VRVWLLKPVIAPALERIPTMSRIAPKLLLVALFVAMCFVLAGCYD
jgi:hypothetical protein